MKVKRTLFIFFSTLVFIVMMVFIELNKSSVHGYILIALLAAGLFILHRLIVKRKNKLLLKLSLWAGALALFVAVVFVSWPQEKAVPAVSVENPEQTGIVSVSQGELRGVYNDEKSVEVYAGIPYAAPPVGDLRWKEPQDPEKWEGVLDADTFAPMSMQPRNLPIYDSLAQIFGYHDYELTLEDNCIRPMSEDSLYLNIWKPTGSSDKLPVLVYFHGGSLKQGLTWYSDYNGESLAREGVVVVNVAYRLGVFGFFADDELSSESGNSTTGNYGLLDQIKSLEWVRDNIKAFSGDPDNVTIAGESAGAACVSALCTSPLCKGLFKYAILESSTLASTNPPHSFRSYDNAVKAGKETKDRLGCGSVADLRALSADELIGETDYHHHITVDGYALTENPYLSYKKGVHNEKAILHGYNEEESGPFIVLDHADLNSYSKKIMELFGKYTDDVIALYPASTDDEADKYWAKIFGAVYFDYPHYCLNRLAALNDIPVYEYSFSKNNGRLGRWHSGELVYCYGNIPEKSPLYDESDRELSGVMLAYWKNFASTGDPNGGSLPEWKPNLSSDSLMLFSDNTGMTVEQNHGLFEILDKIEGWDSSLGQ